MKRSSTEKFSAWLTKELKRNKRSLYWLAKSMGKQYTTVHRWKSGTCEPSLSNANAVRRCFEELA
jgi:hypothetical protein